MTTHEAIPSMTPAVEPLLDTDPAISFDIKLKKQLKPGQIIDVDYPALRETLQLLDSPADNSDLSLTVRPKRGLGLSTYGQYSRGANHIDVTLRGKKTTQKVTQHELRHYTDMAKNPVTTSEDTGNAIGNLAGTVIMPTTFANIGLSATKEALNVSDINQFATQSLGDENYATLLTHLELAHNTSIATSLSAIAIQGIFYWGNKRERTARKAEKVKAPRIITINKADNT